jgi:hypothetical protein
MNSGIRIIKRSELGKPKSIPTPHAVKTEHQRERDTASTVQRWVTEWKDQKRSLAAFTLFRALDQPTVPVN